jgi:ABC-type transporter Mla subunit MlaD
MNLRKSLQSRLILRFTVLMLIMFVAVQGIVLYSFREFGIATSKNKALIASEMIRDVLTQLMEQDHTDERDAFLAPLTGNAHLKEIRVLRGDLTSKEYGEPPENMRPRDAFERSVLDTGTIRERTTESARQVTYQVMIPYKADDSGSITCLSCHDVKEGDVLGAVGVTMDLTGERKEGLVTFLYTAGVSFALYGVFLLLMFRYMRGSFTRPMANVIDGLTAASEQFTGAAQQISEASQNLAEGTGQQAASVEETLSTLEELSGIASRNATNAQEASRLAEDARKLVDQGSRSITEMTHAITEMKETSDRSARIIRTIDEIAFQTNLLSLNAAVEAARAGEAGKGFAVVAEEVRNLAHRSAQAAKETGQLLAAAQEKAKHGVSSAGEVDAALGQISSAIQQVVALVRQVAEASNEQSQGVSLINNSVGEIDRVSQGNAANAEETAATSEEFSAQAIGLLDIVSTVDGLVHGSRNGSRLPPPSAAERAGASRSTRRDAVSAAVPPRLVAPAELKRPR